MNAWEIEEVLREAVGLNFVMDGARHRAWIEPGVKKLPLPADTAFALDEVLREVAGRLASDMEEAEAQEAARDDDISRIKDLSDMTKQALSALEKFQRAWGHFADPHVVELLRADGWTDASPKTLSSSEARAALGDLAGALAEVKSIAEALETGL
jgi:hypothetical protein